MESKKEGSTAQESPVSKDYFYKGKIVVYQNSRGFRFSVDAPILADFLPYSPHDALEIGTGCGIISLLACHHKKFPLIHAVEIQETLSQLAVTNVSQNGFSASIRVIHNDLKKIYPQFTGIREVFANPPFFKTTTGRLSPNPEVKKAKSEVLLTLRELFKIVQSILGEEGNFHLILPYQRYDEIIQLAEEAGLFPVKIRKILTDKDGKAARFLIQLTNHEVILINVPPLVIYKDRKKNIYTDEMEKILEG